MFGIICHYFFCSNWELIQSFLNLILPSLIQFVARKIVLGRITFFYFPSTQKFKFHHVSYIYLVKSLKLAVLVFSQNFVHDFTLFVINVQFPFLTPLSLSSNFCREMYTSSYATNCIMSYITIFLLSNSLSHRGLKYLTNT